MPSPQETDRVYSTASCAHTGHTRKINLQKQKPKSADSSLFVRTVYMVVLITAQLWYTMQHRTFLIIFPIILSLRIITALMRMVQQ